MTKYDVRQAEKNWQNEFLYSVIDLERNEIIKSELTSKDAALFIENLSLLEELKTYIENKQLDFEKVKNNLSEKDCEVLASNYNHNVDLLLLRLERLTNNLKKIDDNQQAEKLVKKFEKFRLIKWWIPYTNEFNVLTA